MRLVGQVERIKTGIERLDEIIQGGIPKKSITLVSGPPGGGKTILCFQFINEGIKNNEKCLFLTLDKKPENIINQAKEIGFDLEKGIEENKTKILHLDINKKKVYEKMTNEILSEKYDRIVLDSITPLAEIPVNINNKNKTQRRDINIITPDEFPHEDLPVKRLHLRYIINALEKSGSTSLITSELSSGSTSLSRDGVSEFLVDGVITLSLDPTMDRRKLSIMKMRNTKHTLKPQKMIIDKGGIKLV